MHAPLDVSIYLNNALSARHLTAELESDTPLPDAIRDMPETVSGYFKELDEATRSEIASAWKQTIVLNATRVLYTFTFDPATAKFYARKR